MIFKVEYNSKVKYILCSRGRIHYVAQQLAGYKEKKSKKHGVQRIPNKYKVTRLGRLNQLREIRKSKTAKAHSARQILEKVEQL